MLTTTQESFNTIAENTEYGLVTLGDMTIDEVETIASFLEEFTIRARTPH